MLRLAGGCAERATLGGLADRVRECGAAVMQNGFAMRDEQPLDVELDQRPHQAREAGSVDTHAGEPALRADGGKARAVARADEPIAEDERRDRREPVDGLPRPAQRPRLDPGRDGVPGPLAAALVARRQLLAVATVPLDRREDADLTPRDVLVEAREERLPALARQQRVDQDGRAGRVEERAGDFARPVVRAAGSRRRVPPGVRRRPAVQAGDDLVQQASTSACQ